MPAPFTQAAGGFVITRRLTDGRTLIEGFVLDETPFDRGAPHHAIVYSQIAATEEEAVGLVDEFVSDLAAPLTSATVIGIDDDASLALPDYWVDRDRGGEYGDPSDHYYC
jgi:hypothetical protein